MTEDIQTAETIGKMDSALVDLQYKIEVLEEAVAKLSAYIIEGENNA
tara:strand:- start:283 stop:423 length:141 start_codon:yes stop_codon:yes gene_type:complete